MKQQLKDRRTRFQPRPVARNAALAVAGIAGVFSAVVATLLVANYIQIRLVAPLDEPHLAELRQELIKSPAATPEVVKQIETLDLLARKAFLTSQDHIRIGAWLLLGGVAVFLVALRLAAKLKPRLPAPESGIAPETFWHARRHASRLIAGAGAAFVAVALLTSLATDLKFPTTPAAPSEKPEPAAKAETPPPDWETVQQYWPSFRGPGAYGVATHTTAPADWDGTTGKNIKWKTEIPLPGRNSPVVWGDKIFLSGATKSEREIYCFDANTGEILWRHPVERTGEPPEISEDTGYAPSTMVVHGSRVFAIFPSGDVAACDFDGKRLWIKHLGAPDNHYGHSSSLLAYGELVFVQYDQVENSKLIALDAADGHEVWVRPREHISWASPAVIPTEFGPQLILNDEKNVDAYEPVSGNRLWQVECLGGEVAPSPAYGGGMIFVANEYAMASALKLGGTPDAPTAELAWEWDEALPDVSSPVGDGTHFYVATSMGYVVCLRAADGEMPWHHEFDEGFYSSPVVVGDRVFVADRAGVMHVFKTGAEYVPVADSPLGEPILTTPAFLDKRVYIRTDKHLWCMAAPE